MKIFLAGFGVVFLILALNASIGGAQAATKKHSQKKSKTAAKSAESSSPSKSDHPLSDEGNLPPVVMEPDPMSEPGSPPTKQEVEIEPFVPNTEVSAVADEKPDEPSAKPTVAEEIALESPTRSVEEYEQARLARLHRTTLMDYSINLTLAPKAFSKVDLRAPTKGGFDQSKPSLFGILLGYDRAVYKHPGTGIVIGGVDGGIYTSTVKDPFSGLLAGIMSVAPHVQYQALFVRKQWVVPTVKLDFEFVRYSYSFQNKNVQGFKTLPRVDLGLLVFLNVFEPASAGEMESNYGIRKTYVAAYLSMARDSGKQDFDMSENAIRLGFRFEH